VASPIIHFSLKKLVLSTGNALRLRLDLEGLRIIVSGDRKEEGDQTFRSLYKFSRLVGEGDETRA
jgi:hypothetical protein